MRLSRILSLLFLALGTALAGEFSAQDFSLPAKTRESGRPLSRHFTFRDYAAHHQNWTAVEDRHGVPHFGNKGCVLEYDGLDWRRIEVPGTTFVRGLARAPDGTLYVGAVDELGFIEVTEVGEKRFVSLREKLPAAHREFGDIWEVVATNEGVFFGAGRRIFRWHEGRFHVWELPGQASVWLFRIEGKVYFHRRGEALQRIDGDALVPVCDAPFFRRNRIPIVFREIDDALVIGSANEGLAKLDLRTGQLQPFPTEIDGWLRREGLVAMTRVGMLRVFASREAGVMVTDVEGKFIRRFDEADGLHDPVVKHFLPATNNQLWLSHNNGLSLVSLPLIYTLFGRDQGLDGTSVRAIARHRGELHVATGRGVFRLEPADPVALTNARLVPVTGLRGRFFSLLSTPEGLFAGENDGLQFLGDGASSAATPPLLAGESVVLLAASARTPGRVWAGTLRGIYTLDRTTDGWRVTPPPVALQFEARSLAEAPDGTLWLGTFTRGVVRVRWEHASGEPEAVFLKGSSAVPTIAGSMQVSRAGQHVMLACADGSVWRYDETHGRFVAAEEPSKLTGPPQPKTAAIVISGHEGALDAMRILDASGCAFPLRLPALLAATGPLQQAMLEPDGAFGYRVWFAGVDGLGLATLDVPLPLLRPPGVMLRAARASGHTTWPQDNALPAGAHRVSFVFSASAYAPAAEFSTWLEGFDADWTPFSATRSREFTNLPPGRYVLHVQARHYRALGLRQSLFAFSITAPWWASWWARAGVASLALAGVAGVFSGRVRLLRRRSAQLEKTVDVRTAELRASEEQLRGARDAAEAANRAKSAFLAHMSHELRTPLNGILGYAQVLRRAPEQSPAARERLGVIVQSGEHLLALINEILDLAKVEAGKMQLRASDVSLASVARAVADLVRPRCEEKSLHFALELAPGLPRSVRTDEQKLRQVLLNLLGNAAKFTAHGRVALSLAPTGEGRVRFVVEDTGPGISPERLSSLFQPFDSTGTTAAQGTGLGLALSQRMVELLGGRIRVESTVGAGSRFHFDLPLPESVMSEPVAPAGRTIAGYAGAPRRLLVVDDEATNRAVLRELLTPLGFEIVEAADGASAVAALRSTQPQAVLLDLRFATGSDGLAIARGWRSEPDFASLKIIAVSASVFESDRHEALAAGCDAFLAKPFKEEQLFALLEATLGLDWIYISPPPTPAGPAAALRTEVRSELLELARRGDARRLRERLATLAQDPAHAAEARRLDELAATFQMKKLRELLGGDRP